MGSVKLVADSGSTKTDWRLIDIDGQVHEAQTIGLNPFFVSEDEIFEVAESLRFNDLDKTKPDEVFFYGASCSEEEMIAKMLRGLGRNWPNSTINIDHDLFGAARATCGDREGIVSILGTGSSTCLYDGQKIVEAIPALGYVFADEGSGSHLGKTFLTKLLTGLLPKTVEDAFSNEFGFNREQILERVYSQPRPNRFLASFAPFIRSQIHIPEMKELVEGCFNQHIDTYILRYSRVPDQQLNVVGSIAYFFKDNLEIALSKHGLRLGTVVKSPIDALVQYHSE